MGGNAGFRTNSLYGGYGYGYGDYLCDMSKFFTRSLDYCPGNIWNARNWTQALNVYTHQAAQPYGFYYNFTGRPHYVVADPFQMPYQIAMGLHGYADPSVPTAASTAAKLEMMTAQAGMEAKAGQTFYDLSEAKTISSWKDAKCLAGDDEEKMELRQEAEELGKKIEKALTELQEAMENKAKLTPDEVGKKIDAIIAEAKPLITQAKELADKCRKIEAEYNNKKADEKAVKDKAEEGDDPSVENPDDAVDDSDAPAEDERPDYVPPENKTSPEKDKVTKEGTRVKVKAKGGTEELAGKYYEYDGKIYKVTNGEAKPVDVTDKVEKMPAAS